MVLTRAMSLNNQLLKAQKILIVLGLFLTPCLVQAQEKSDSKIITPPSLFEKTSTVNQELKPIKQKVLPKRGEELKLKTALNSLTERETEYEALPTPEPLSATEIRLSFDRGRNAYLYGNYQEAVEYLTPLLSPSVLIADPQMLTLAYEYLGLAHFYLGDENIAKGFFKDLIYFKPEHRLDPVRVPPNAVSLYNQLHDALQAELSLRQEAMARQAELEEERVLKKMRQQVILEQQVNQKLIAFLPFGAGQFQNREPGLGYFFLGSELISVGLSAGFFWGVESLRQSDGRFMKRDYLFAQQLQRAQMISGGVAIGLMVSGVLLALWRYKDRHDLGNYLDLNQIDQDDLIEESSPQISPMTPEE